MKPNNSAATLISYLKFLDIPVTETSIIEELDKHPNRGSLFAVSDVLNNWNVPNAAFKAEINNLHEVPLPFIAQLSSSNNEFVLVEKISTEGYTVSNERLSSQLMSPELFAKSFKQIILVAEADKDSGEADYSQKKRREYIEKIRTPFLISGAALILLTAILQSMYSESLSWQTALLIFFKTAGLITSVLLLIQSIDSNNPLIERLCSAANNRDCNAILSSKAAKVTNELSWSEVGFFYFAGTLPIVVYGASSPSLMQVLAIINILCLPYTLYSVYYQYKMARQWCVFCCTVQALLWLEFFAFFNYLTYPFSAPGVAELGSLFMSFAFPVLLWAFVKPLLLKAKQLQPLKQQVLKFKYNTKLFRKVLEEQKRHELPAETDTMVLGNVEAENIITMVSNPYCQPCAKAHKILDEWITGLENIRVQIVFATQDSDQDKKTVVARHLMLLNASPDRELPKKALHDWYEQKQKNYEAWAEAYPAQHTGTGNALARQKEWCNTNGIKSTPTILINGYRLPDPWQLEDIKYFMN